MPCKGNNDFKEKYPHVPVGALEPMGIKDTLTKNSCFLQYANVLEYELDTKWHGICKRGRNGQGC